MRSHLFLWALQVYLFTSYCVLHLHASSFVSSCNFLVCGRISYIHRSFRPHCKMFSHLRSMYFYYVIHAGESSPYCLKFVIIKWASGFSSLFMRQWHPTGFSKAFQYSAARCKFCRFSELNILIFSIQRNRHHYVYVYYMILY